MSSSQPYYLQTYLETPGLSLHPLASVSPPVLCRMEVDIKCVSGHRKETVHGRSPVGRELGTEKPGETARLI